MTDSGYRRTSAIDRPRTTADHESRSARAAIAYRHVVERGTLRGLALFRWASWLWMAVVVLLNRNDLARPLLAWSLVTIAFLVTIATTLGASAAPRRLLTPPFVFGELAVAFVLQFAGGWAYGTDPFASAHSLGSAWPLAGVLGSGTAWGAVRAGVAGGAIGAARLLQPLTAGIGFAAIERSQWFSIASSIVLYVLAGAISGHVADLLRRLERDISAAKARDEVARTLHDGVLQTLAIIEHRADDPQLARLAREQDRELREYLFGSADPHDIDERPDLGRSLRRAAATFEDRFDGRAVVVLAPDLGPVSPTAVDAVAGAVSESLTNAGKHGRARTVHVYIEPDDELGLMCSIRDDGVGFDVGGVDEGVGLGRSVRARIDDVGGRVEIESWIGTGTEVRLWLPR